MIRAGKRFNQEGIEVEDELVEDVVKTFNGMVGWLTYFGYNYVRRSGDLDEIASKIALSEIKHYLNTRGGWSKEIC